MAENTKIEWATHTFNPWLGCSKVSPACMNCYAERDFDHRLGQVQWGPNGTRVLTGSENWAKPLKWNRDVQRQFEVAQAQWVADCCVGTKSYPEPELKQFRKRVFCASLADVFEDWQGPILNSKGERILIACNGDSYFTSGPVSNSRDLTMDVVRQRLFALIDATPNLDWLLLTKRPENIRKMWPAVGFPGAGVPGTLGRQLHLSNVWLGTSVENQEYADKRIPELLKCRDLSPVLFLSCEPLLGPIDLSYPDSLYPDGPEYCCSGFECGCRGLPIDPPAYLNKAFGGVDWVIAGGESGPQARPSDPDWFRSLRDQCQAAGVPFLFKQWGEWVPSDHDSVKMSDNEVCPWNDKPRSDVIDTKQRDNSNTVMCRVGKVRAGRVLDGVTHDGFPVPFQQS
jgi:protein gp37